jgi:hypothetical protein
LRPRLLPLSLPLPSFTDIGLANGTYYYVIVATNFGGNSTLSNMQNGVVSIPPVDGGPDPIQPPMNETNGTTNGTDSGSATTNLPPAGASLKIAGYPIGVMLFCLIFCLEIIIKKRKNPSIME